MNELIKSPMNYVGGKYKLLPQILPLFPKDINTFIDLFGGGLDISLNTNADSIISNDIVTPIIELYSYWKSQPTEAIISEIDSVILKYNLSKTNLEGYLKLREDYNLSKDVKLLFPLIAHCYNNQIRFNSKWGFNRHFGKDKHDFNDTMRANLIKTINTIHNKNIKFINKDVFSMNFEKLNSSHFVYCDQPYLITYADYSVQASWDEEKEIKLLEILDGLNSRGIKFALSNVLEHNGKSNDILKDWAKKYKINYLDYDYNNANADKKIKKNGKSVEVLITNY